VLTHAGTERDLTHAGYNERELTQAGVNSGNWGGKEQN